MGVSSRLVIATNPLTQRNANMPCFCLQVINGLYPADPFPGRCPHYDIRHTYPCRHTDRQSRRFFAAAAVRCPRQIIACEDTRVTRKLLNLTGTATGARMVAYHDHNGAAMRPWLFDQLADGKAVVLVSDAGTPLISDPGYKLVVAPRAGHPGACRSGPQRGPCGARHFGITDGQVHVSPGFSPGPGKRAVTRSARSRSCARRQSGSRPRRASRRALPTWPTCSAPARRRWPAS